MTLLRRGDLFPALLLASCSTLTIGCASPGPPHPPSLRLPQPVRDLDARRSGDSVELLFTVPWQSTDKLPLHGASLRGVLCRELERQNCIAVAGLAPPILGPHGEHNLFTLHDKLPPALASGPPRLLSYRVEFFSKAGRSAGKSDAAYTVAGSAPTAVTGLNAEGSRLGVVLSWTALPATEGEVLLQREDLAPRASTGNTKPAATSARKSGKHTDSSTVWLKTNTTSNRTLDTTTQPGTPYRYTAVRQRIAQLGSTAGITEGRSIPYRSADSARVDFILNLVYPPPSPTALTAADFTSATGSFAIDLIWQPVDDSGLLAGLAGYNVYREAINPDGRPLGERTRLNASPLLIPAFHDANAKPHQRYRYSVTALDQHGNESAAAVVVLEPSPASLP